VKRNRQSPLGRLIPYTLPLIAAFFAGCATAPHHLSISSTLAAERLFIGSTPYLTARTLTRAVQGEGRWDREAYVWILTAGSHELRVAAEMSVALVDGEVVPLSAVPRLWKGELILPERLWADQLSRWGIPPMAPFHRSITRFRTAILDPGHGGRDPGAIGRRGLQEKVIALDVAKRLRDLLVREGFRVVMTRYDDRFIPLRKRSAIANREEGNLFISIHANASRRRSVSGFEAFYLSAATDDHARALAAAENVQLPDELGESIPTQTHAILWDLLYTEYRAESTELAAQVCRGLAGQGLPSRNRGVKSARFAVLKGSRMPSILVEVGFLSNLREESRLRETWYRQRLAEGIRDGILNFKHTSERSYAARR